MTILAPYRTGSLLDRFFDDWDGQALVHTPEIQVKKNDKEFRVLANIPGVKKENVKVEIENGYLRLSGKYEQKEEKDYESVHSEFRTYSEFQRSLSLDLSRIDINKMDAKFENGLLEVHLPLKEAEKPKYIAVK